jgi:hypothetical protein
MDRQHESFDSGFEAVVRKMTWLQRSPLLSPVTGSNGMIASKRDAAGLGSYQAAINHHQSTVKVAS